MFERTVNVTSTKLVLGERLVEQGLRGEAVVANMTDILLLDECIFSLFALC